MAGWLERWDRRNQRWADRMIATPPKEPSLGRWSAVWMAFVAFDLLAGGFGWWGVLAYAVLGVAVVIWVQRRRRR